MGSKGKLMNSSGIINLDDLLGGGYPKGITCISGPRGSGKTQLLLAAAQAALANNVPVVFFSFDADLKLGVIPKASALGKVYFRIDTLDEAVKKLRGSDPETLVLMDGVHKAFVYKGPDAGTVEDGSRVLKARWFNDQVSTLRKFSSVILTSEEVLRYKALTHATSTAIELKISGNSDVTAHVTKNRFDLTASSLPLVFRGHGQVLPMEIRSRFERF